MKEAGYISQIIGPVLDIVFPDGNLPKIYNAIEIRSEEKLIVCEVQQLLGDNRVRAVSMSSTDGLKRNAKAIDTGAPISVPVGSATLGRIFNVVGSCIDAYMELSFSSQFNTTIPIRFYCSTNSKDLQLPLKMYFVELRIQGCSNARLQ